jgi:hypothetical protein
VEGGYGMAIALDDAPVTLNRPLRDGETLAVTVRRGVGRAGVRLVGAPTAYTVWIETTGIAVLERDGAEQGRVPVSGDAQRVTLTYASGTLTASVGGSAFPPLSDGTAFAGLRAEFVVQGGNGQGSTFDDITVPLPPGLVMHVASPTATPSAQPSPTRTFAPGRHPTSRMTPSRVTPSQATPTVVPWPPASAGMSASQRGANVGAAAQSAANPPAANVNLLTNPTFTSGLTGWLTAFYFAVNHNGGLLASQANNPGYGTAYQDIPGAFAAGMPLVWQVDLGHIYDTMTNRVQLVLHGGDWTTARVCTFNRAGAGFAARTYVMSATVPSNWSRVYAMVWTLDGMGTFRVTRGDLRCVPGAVVPNGLLCGQVAPTVTPTPTHTNTPSLIDYGITLVNETAAGGQYSWSEQEVANILAGAAIVSDALTRFGTMGSSPAARFRTVMGNGPVIFLRLREWPPSGTMYANFYDQTRPGLCSVFGPMTFFPDDNSQSVVIACRGFMRQTDTWITNGVVTTVAVVHELGHVLDIRSDRQLRGYVGSSSLSLQDCNGPRVMGVAPEDVWRRGQRGWGSTAPDRVDGQEISQFQQNPYDQRSHIETAADMFLNWVYRRTSDAAPTGIPVGFVPSDGTAPPDACAYPLSGNWVGFRNINRDGLQDASAPGNVRYWWMEGTLGVIFASRSWR